MKYARFEDLPVWQAASDLALRIFALGEKLPLRRHRSLRDQIERAALSVSNNIAEGFERPHGLAHPALYAFLGGTIGNFYPPAAIRLLALTSRLPPRNVAAPGRISSHSRAVV